MHREADVLAIAAYTLSFLTEKAFSRPVDYDAILLVSSGLVLCRIVPVIGHAASFGEKGSVLDNVCVNHPLLDFVHPDDRRDLSDAVLQALIRREHVRCVCIAQEQPEQSVSHGLDLEEKNQASQQFQVEQRLGSAIARIRDLSGSFTAYSFILRNDPRELFMHQQGNLLMELKSSFQFLDPVPVVCEGSTPGRNLGSLETISSGLLYRSASLAR